MRKNEVADQPPISRFTSAASSRGTKTSAGGLQALWTRSATSQPEIQADLCPSADLFRPRRNQLPCGGRCLTAKQSFGIGSVLMRDMINWSRRFRGCAMAPGKLLTVALVLAMFTVFGYAADGPPVRHVVLVSVDGLAASYLNDPRAEMPT